MIKLCKLASIEQWSLINFPKEKNMKKSIILLGILILAACRPSTPPAPTPEPIEEVTMEPTATQTAIPSSTPEPEVIDPVWERIQSAGKIVVGMSADYPPFAYIGEDFILQGFEMAMLQEISKRLDLPLDIKNMAFDGLIDAVQIDQIDMAVAAITYTEERDGFVDFSNMYFVGEDAVLAYADSPTVILKPEELAAYRVGVQSGSIYETWLQDNLVEPGLMKPQSLYLYQTPQEAIEALIGTNPPIDLVVMDFLPADLATRSQPVKVAGRGITPQFYAIAIPQGAVTLQEALNQTIMEMDSDGTLARLAREYLNIDQIAPLPTPAPTAIPATPSACLDGMAFVQDLNHPDNNMQNPPRFPPSTLIQKGWRIRNVGTCTWNSSYRMVYTGANPAGAPVSGPPVFITGVVAPGQMADVFVTLTTPPWPGRFQSFWSMQNGNGLLFGERVYAGFEVVVQPSPATPTATPTLLAPVINSFTVDHDQVPVGQCVTLSWQFYAQGQVLSRLFRNGQLIQQDLPFSGSYPDCPPGPGRVEYRLNVDVSSAGSAVSVQVVEVFQPAQPTPTPEPTAEQPPTIAYLLVDNNEITIGQCVNLTWSFSGSSLVAATMFRNDQPIASDLVPTGSLTDCPDVAGQMEYRLRVDSEFAGSAQASQFVNVVGPTAK
jgi:polar amino acid transport system substrate-binding protein